MQIKNKAFVVQRSFDGRYSMDLINYRLSLVAEVGGVQACLGPSEIPLMAWIGSDIDKALEVAMVGHKVISITVEVPE